MPTLAIIIVSWNTRDLLRRSIQTIHASLTGAGIDYTIVVVDNASSDGTPAMLRAEHPEVLLLEAGRNLGFAGGNNLAMRRALEFGVGVGSAMSNPQSPIPQSPDYVFLLNPDTEVVGDAIPALVRYMETHPDVAVVGPQLRYADGSVQSSRRRFPTKGVYFWESTPLEQRWPNNPWARRYHWPTRPTTPSRRSTGWSARRCWFAAPRSSAPACSTPALRCTRKSWNGSGESGGMGDGGLGNVPAPSPSIPGHAIVYLPDAVIIHHEGKSSEQALARRYLNFQHGRLRDARMVYGQRFAAQLRLFLRVAYAAELVIEAAKWLLGHKRSLRARRIAIYRQVLREL